MSPIDNKQSDWPGHERSDNTDQPQPNSFYQQVESQQAAPVGSAGITAAPGERPAAMPGSAYDVTSANTGPSVGILPPAQPAFGSASYIKENKFWTKRKKIILGILVPVLLLLAIGGGAAFAMYNSSTKVVGDAITNALLAETAHIKGDAKVSGESEGRHVGVTVDYDIKSNNKLMQADLGVDVNVPPMSIDLSGGIISDVSGDFYFKIDNAKQIFQNLFGIDTNSVDPSIDGANTLVEMVDNKWVKVDAADLEESMTEEEKRQSECHERLAKDMSENRDLTREVTNVYRQHDFINADALDSDDISILHYKLTFDEEKAKSFAAEFKSTEIHKRLVDCDKEFEIKEDDIKKLISQVNKANIEVWIDRWSHQFTKISISGKEKSVNYSATMDTTFDQPVAILVPQDATPFKKIQEEYMNMLGGFYGGFEPTEYEDGAAYDEDLFTSSGELNPSVLGSRTFRLLPW